MNTERNKGAFSFFPFKTVARGRSFTRLVTLLLKESKMQSLGGKKNLKLHRIFPIKLYFIERPKKHQKDLCFFRITHQVKRTIEAGFLD